MTMYELVWRSIELRDASDEHPGVGPFYFCRFTRLMLFRVVPFPCLDMFCTAAATTLLR